MKHKKRKYIAVLLLVMFFLLLLFPATGRMVQAAGLFDTETVDAANEYSKYSPKSYQLDFYVDRTWEWLPWNFKEKYGEAVLYGLYLVTNGIWSLSVTMSNATGYAVQSAYQLDFITETVDYVGKNIQTIAGVSPKGFKSEGFYPGLILLLLLILGVYVTYTGLIKREVTKAVNAALHFVLIFIVSACFIAYAPSYINKINEFSSDISSAALTLGTKLSVSEESSEGNSVDIIRDVLFSVQIKQPWLLLQYGTTDADSIGQERIDGLLKIDPDKDKSNDREMIVRAEIDYHDNLNMTVQGAVSRFGMVIFFLIINVIISIVVLLFSGNMIFSQVLFIAYVTMLPISCLVSMIPSQESTVKRAIMKVCNAIMMRAGIIIIMTTACSISTMFYSISVGKPFFRIIFLQIITFAGIYAKQGELLSIIGLQQDTQQVNKVMLFPKRFLPKLPRPKLPNLSGIYSTMSGGRGGSRGTRGGGTGGTQGGGTGGTGGPHNRPNTETPGGTGDSRGNAEEKPGKHNRTAPGGTGAGNNGTGPENNGPGGNYNRTAKENGKSGEKTRENVPGNMRQTKKTGENPNEKTPNNLATGKPDTANKAEEPHSRPNTINKANRNHTRPNVTGNRDTVENADTGKNGNLTAEKPTGRKPNAEHRANEPHSCPSATANQNKDQHTGKGGTTDERGNKENTKKNHPVTNDTGEHTRPDTVKGKHTGRNENPGETREDTRQMNRKPDTHENSAQHIRPDITKQNKEGDNTGRNQITTVDKHNSHPKENKVRENRAMENQHNSSPRENKIVGNKETPGKDRK